MIRTFLRVACLVLAVLAARPGAAQPGPAFESAAQKLRAAVITVRVTDHRPAGDAEAGSANGDRSPRVTVCSGVSLGQGLLVAPLSVGSDRAVRGTRAGGAQIEGRVRVLDAYSGLALVETEDRSLPGLELAESLPAVGSWVLSAAGWGAEDPIVSLGIIGGADRVLPGTSFPPLLQCDVRTAETSSGAALVDAEGRLVGVVVAIEDAATRRGWTYAVPASHVRRLMRIHATQAAETGVTVLKRRRPEVGMTLDGTGDQVFVSRVVPGSPADKADLRPGDQILAADGAVIRSVYQALRPVLARQPGDRMTFRVRRDAVDREVAVVLGGGVELPDPSGLDVAHLVRPQVAVEGLADGTARTRDASRELAAVGQDATPVDARSSEQRRVALLEEALDRYRSVIAFLQGELQQHEKERAELQAKIQTLRDQLERGGAAAGKAK